MTMNAEARSYHRYWDTEVCILKGDSRQGLIQQAEKLRRYVSGGPQVALKDLAYTLNSRLGEAPYRLAIVASSLQEVERRLTSALQRLPDAQCQRIKHPSGIYFFQHPLSRQGELAFLFPGEGSQYPNMLSELCLHFPEVRAWFDLIDRAFISHKRSYLPSQFIFPLPSPGTKGSDSDPERLWQMDGAVEGVFTAGQALFTLLSRLEIRPHLVLGHSSGEYSALLASGALQVESDERLIQHILDLNNIYEEVSAAGQVPEAVLLTVGAADRALVTTVVEQSGDPIYIAMDNCPHQVVLCGTEAAIGQAAERLRGKGAVCNTLPFNRAYHTPLFEDFCQPLRNFFQSLKIVSPKIPLYSCAIAGPYPHDPEEIRQLALAQWARPVRFRETIEAMYEAGVRIFVEVGPRGNLTSFVDDILRGRPNLAVATNLPGRSGTGQLNHLVALLAAHHVPMRLDHLYARREPKPISLEPGGTVTDKRRDEVGMMKLSLRLPTLRLTRGSPAIAPATPTAGTPPQKPSGVDRRPAERQTPAERAPQDLPTSAVLTPSVPQSTGKVPLALPGTSLAPSSRTTLSANAVAQTGLRSQVMEEYLHAMERFLEVQRGVMLAFMADNGAPVLPTESVVAAPSGVHASTGRPLGADGGTRAEEPQEAGLAADRGSPDNRASAAPSPLPDTAPDVPGGRGESASPPERVGRMSPEAITRRLVSLVSEKTGYPVDLLDVTLNMEADLGIDSIKRIEILGAFQRETSAIVAEDLEGLSRLKTLQQILDFVTARLQASPAAVTSPASGGAGPPTTTVLPFIRTVVSLIPGREVVALCELDLEEDLFLRDHTLSAPISVTDPSLIGLPVVPLTVSLEMLAEAASALEPGKVVIGMENIRAYRWMVLEHGRLPLRLRARRKAANEVAVEIREDEDNAGAGIRPAYPIIEGTVVFGDAYPEAPAAEAFTLRGERPSKWPAGRMYDGTGMFHGPLFRVVHSMDCTGQDGAEATMIGQPVHGFFRSHPDPAFLVDPVLLDAMGQVVGYWTGDHFEVGLSVFPFKLERLRLFGPSLTAGARATCRVRVTFVDDQWIQSNIDIVGENGRLLVQMIKWEDRRLDLPREFYDFRISPRDVLLSAHWPTPCASLPTPDAFRACRLTRFPEEIFEGHGMIWLRVLAYMVLSEDERKAWHNLKGPPSRRVEWLMGRIAAKDAIRVFLKDRYQLALCPADIEIVSDEHGQPRIGGRWTLQIDRIPVVSLSHTAGVAVAVAGPGGAGGVGIDVERVARIGKELRQVAFSPSEEALLASLGDAACEEWSARLWCAKEAVGKALGRGLVGGPSGLVVQGVNVDTGTVKVLLSGGVAKEVPDLAGKSVTAYTARDGEMAVACALSEMIGMEPDANTK